MSCKSGCGMNSSSSSKNSNNSGANCSAYGSGLNMGRGPELKYEFYFPENGCMVTEPATPCRKVPYPLQNIPTCTTPCLKNMSKEIYGHAIPSSLYGAALQQNGSDGSYYYNDPGNLGMAPLTFGPGMQPYRSINTF